ncbi:MAG: hypothetical protein GY860_00820 [Desulfobacteraceae bacterium]|nr:hypothetical protein [Desulfobacteraceae bacterium]
MSISDPDTLSTIQKTLEKNSYLLDPHGAVAVAAANALRSNYSLDTKIICLATAHPAKFPKIITKGLGRDLPPQALHPSLINGAKVCQELRICDCEHLEFALVKAMEEEAKKGKKHG